MRGGRLAPAGSALLGALAMAVWLSSACNALLGNSDHPGAEGGTLDATAPDGRTDRDVKPRDGAMEGTSESGACMPDPVAVPPDAGPTERYARCGDASGVDLLYNSGHCGWCGHDCQGTPCDSGVCGVATVSTGALPVRGTGTDGRDLFFVTQTEVPDAGLAWSVHHALPDGGVASVGTKPWLQSGASVQSVLVSSSDVYVSFGPAAVNGWVFDQPRSGDPWGEVFLPDGFPTGVALVPSTVALTTTGEVGTANFGDASVNEIASGRGALGAVAATPDGTVYWMEQPTAKGSHWTLFAFEGYPRVVHSDPSFSQFDIVVADARYVYLAQASYGAILRFSVAEDGGAAPESFWGPDPALSTFVAMAMDDDNLYWFACNGNSVPCTLFEKAKCGGAATVLAQGEPWAPGDLAPVGNEVYWTGASGTLCRVAR
jgi:hypothetical protein